MVMKNTVLPPGEKEIIHKCCSGFYLITAEMSERSERIVTWTRCQSKISDSSGFLLGWGEEFEKPQPIDTFPL